MPHTYECPMRWADLDMLGHVNNVTYLDYVAEARHRVLDGAPGEEPLPVTRHRVEFVSPLVLRREPVLVDSWLTSDDRGGAVLHHEVHDGSQDRVVHLRVSSDLDGTRPGDRARLEAALSAYAGVAHEWRPVAESAPRSGDEFPVTVRFADLDRAGHVRDVALVEFFQEARIKYFWRLHTRGEEWSHHVVARTDLELLAPVPHRHEPYLVRSWIAHVGSRSFTVSSELLDQGGAALARASVVMVTFDKETQRSRPMTGSQRERLTRELEQA